VTPALTALAGLLVGYLLGRRRVRHWLADWAWRQARAGGWWAATWPRRTVVVAVLWLVRPVRTWRGWRRDDAAADGGAV
jgi:membrane protein YqaA with SNARE-associated domain